MHPHQFEFLLRIISHCPVKIPWNDIKMPGRTRRACNTNGSKSKLRQKPTAREPKTGLKRLLRPVVMTTLPEDLRVCCYWVRLIPHPHPAILYIQLYIEPLIQFPMWSQQLLVLLERDRGPTMPRSSASIMTKTTMVHNLTIAFFHFIIRYRSIY